MVVKDNKLYRDNGEAINFVPSPNYSNNIQPLYLMIHYTGGSVTSTAVNWLKNKNAKASAHIVIGRDGEITQMVPFNKAAWHAGTSSWGNLNGMNKYSIGIELVNSGPLKKKGDKWCDFWGFEVSNDDVLVATHKNQTTPQTWQEYPKEQLDAVIEVALALNAKFDFDDIIGHDDAAPDRKIDPGPAFPMAQFKSMIMGRK